ncbi:MAG: hypothetical protein R2856_21410 [Caldilineaceae bacterium]
MPVDEAQRYLESFPVLPLPTASIVLLFCFNMAAFRRHPHPAPNSSALASATAKLSRPRSKLIWESSLPPETFYALHLNLIRHGREICDARNPRCELCVLQTQCDYFQGKMSGDKDNEWG